MLRPYQQKAIDMLLEWFAKNPTGNPVLELPTGAGKSHIVAALCKNAVQSWPSTRILMLTHVSELVEQNAEKMLLHWPNAPFGIYSASLKRRNIERITFASIQSVAKKAELLGHRDLVLIDECHLANNEQTGGYRALINALTKINPALRVIGLSASPYRLGQGLLTQGKDALFSDIINPVTIKELVGLGYLAPLKSKQTATQYDLAGVKTRGGEFVAGDLAKAVDQDAINSAAIDEIINRAGERKHWLLFCTGVDHANHCADMLNDRGIVTRCITGNTKANDRAQWIADYKTGNVQCLTGADVLTTGFDAPNTDLVAMLRPTKSPALYLQIVGRGMRLKSHTDHCLVLDFAGNVDRHGPVTNIIPPKPKGKGGGEAPVKSCPNCSELIHTSVMICPDCGHIFEAKPKEWALSNACIMGIEPEVMSVTAWQWDKHTSRSNGKEMLKVRYYGSFSHPVVTEYVCIAHDGPAGNRARMLLARMANSSGCHEVGKLQCLSEIASTMTKAKPPKEIQYLKRGKFYDVSNQRWH